MPLLLSIATVASGFLAAWYWFRSAQASPVPTWATDAEGRLKPLDHIIEPVIRDQAAAGAIGGILRWAEQSARLNKVAAAWSGVTVLLGAFSSMFSALNN